MGVLIQKVDLNSTEEIADACEGKDLVVSALSGLEDVIVDLQKRILIFSCVFFSSKENNFLLCICFGCHFRDWVLHVFLK